MKGVNEPGEAYELDEDNFQQEINDTLGAGEQGNEN